MSERPSFFPEIPTFQAVSPPDFIPGPLGVTQIDTPSTEAQQPPSTEQSVIPQGTATPEHQERITLLGRLGTEIKFKVTPKGTLVASFPLGVHGEDGRTTWENVLAFGERAEKLRDALAKGQTAEVIGYRKERTYKGRDGKEKTVKEIYSTVVKPR